MNPLIISLVKNVFFSGVAFVLIGLIGLLLVPAIVHAYGLEAYGLIVLARIFLPSGLLGLLDFGVSEVATKISAQRRATQETSIAGSSVAPIVLLSALIGISLAISLAVLSPSLSALLTANSDQLRSHEDFQQILLVTAGSLLFIFPALAIEGIVRGAENFLVVRAVEVLSTLCYASITLLAIYFDCSYSWIAYSFLIAALIKAALLTSWVLWNRLLPWGEFTAVTLHDIREAASRGMVFMHSKVLGTVQGQLPLILIGILAGAKGAAIYDVITRLPRFLKSVLGLTSAVMFPTAARLDAGPDKVILGKLVASGLPLLLFSLYPVISAAILFSEPIMKLWIGPGLAAYWHWMALAFFSLAANVILTYVMAIGSAREGIQKKYNVLQLYQIATQFAISFLLVAHLAERAFIVGQAIAVLAVFPVQIRSLVTELDLSRARLWRLMGRHLGIFLLMALLHYFLFLHFEINALAQLALYSAISALLYVVLAYWMVFDSAARGQLRQIVRLFVLR